MKCRFMSAGALVAASVAMATTLRAAEQEWAEGPLTVAQGNVVNLTQDYATNYCATAKTAAVTLHGDLTVAAQHYFVYCWSGEGAVAKSSVYMDLSATGADGDTARLTLDGCALDSYYSNSRRLDVREYAEARNPDEAAITLKNGSSLTMGSIWVLATASSTGDCLTELDIGTDCRVDLVTVNSRSSKPLKVKFSGSGAMMRGWTYEGSSTFFKMVQASCGGFIVEGTADSPVDIRSWTSGTADAQKLLNNDAKSPSKLVFQGDCDVRLVSSAAKTPIEVNLPEIEFRQTGDLVFEGASGGCSSIVSVENVLPAGAGVGNVRVVSVKNKTAHTLQLCGGSQKLNGLILENGSQVACDDAVTLTFGVDDTDGVLDGLSSDDVSVVKVGAGTLTVTNATVASMVVSNGLVVVDGGVLTCGRLETEGSGRVSYRNGGRIVTTAGSATWEIPTADDSLHAIAASAAPQVEGLGLYYAGTTAMTYLDGGTVGDVNIQSGTLRVGGSLVSDLYWRVTFTGAAGGNASAKWDDDDASSTSRYVSLALGRLHPLSVDGAAVNVASSAEGHFASDTATATATASAWSFKSVTYLGWSLNTGKTGVGFTTEALSESNPIVVTVKTTAPVWGYGMSCAGTCPVGAPAAWKVESSADGQTGWTLRDERAGQADRSINMGWQAYGNDGVPYPLSVGTASSFCSTGLVAVAAGSTLDLSEIEPERISIKGLQIDVQSGAGTIVRFVPGANGKLCLSSVPEDWYAGGSIAKMHDLPLTVNGVSGEENLSGWELYVDGERIGGGRVEWKNGKLRAGVPPGGVLIFR